MSENKHNFSEIFECDDKEDCRWSWGRWIPFLLLPFNIAIAALAIYKFQKDFSYWFFAPNVIILILTLAPYALTKSTTVLEIIAALKGKKNA